MDIVEMREKMQYYEETLEAKESELRKLNFEFRDSSNQINSLR